ncbi:MAG: DUF1643 domain-containing protein [Acidobacteria bacterium]|nr:DUF1643 domain-containing protein [Acidobacteriota bacterium]
MVAIGLNPSQADETTNDPTIRRIIGFADDWGYGRLLVVNLFAYCATYPSDLRQASDPIGSENDAWIKKAIEASDLTLIAWGNQGLHLGRDRVVLAFLNQPQCMGTTQLGAPKHPLYLPKSTKPRPCAP